MDELAHLSSLLCCTLFSSRDLRQFVASKMLWCQFKDEQLNHSFAHAKSDSKEKEDPNPKEKSLYGFYASKYCRVMFDEQVLNTIATYTSLSNGDNNETRIVHSVYGAFSGLSVCVQICIIGGVVIVMCAIFCWNRCLSSQKQTNKKALL